MANHKATQRAMWRGARIGAFSLGITGFVGGMSVCIAYQLPFPPLFVTELGVLMGGCLGALAGYSSCFPAGRTALYGLFWGALLGVPAAACTQGPVRILAWLACVFMLGLVGYQAGCGPTNTSDSGWRRLKGR